MNANHDAAASAIAAAIGEPARARMLYSLVDGRARTATELAAVAEVTAATASVHLQRLRARQLVRVTAQGKHRYYSLGGAHVAGALEALSVLAGGSHDRFVPITPRRLRAARTCYDHLAGTLGVALHDRFVAAQWLYAPSHDGAYELTSSGTRALEALGIDVDGARGLRRRFAFACLDWSERRPHIGGALGAALLSLALRKRWVTADLDSRALSLTRTGRRDFEARLGVDAALCYREPPFRSGSGRPASASCSR
jgi:DNA-binding transcriptional ArsR family regulator